MPRALISGVAGQIGSYLAELLLSKGYEVWGLVRRSSVINTSRLDNIYKDPHTPDNKFHLRYGDLSDQGSLTNLVYESKPDEIYHLGAMSHVAVSFEMPEYTADITGTGTLRILEAMRAETPFARFYHSSSSEQFGNAPALQNENTTFDPQSPYAAAKIYAHNITKVYRESYGMYATNGICFNNESPRRGETFVTRKISLAACRIAAGQQDCLYLGNLDAKRDWGYTPEYCEAIWLSLQQDHADDYVFATGTAHTVQEFAELCFAEVGLPLKWVGEGEKRTGHGPDGRTLVAVDPRYYRPCEVHHLQGDASKAKQLLGWEPRTKLADLARIMVHADMHVVEVDNLHKNTSITGAARH